LICPDQTKRSGGIIQSQLPDSDVTDDEPKDIQGQPYLSEQKCHTNRASGTCPEGSSVTVMLNGLRHI
jgi:hypothetical protein